MDFNGKVFVINDDGDGDVGHNCARLMSKRGATIISSPKSALESTDETISLHGKVDGLLIAFPTYRKLPDAGTFDEEEWVRMRSSALDATFRLMKRVWPIMRKQRHGRIVFIMEANSDSIANCAGRFAMLGLMHTLTLEGRKYDIGISVMTNQSPLYVTGVTRTSAVKDIIKYISAFAVSLLHTPDLTHSGALFQVSQRGTSKWKWQRNQGVLLNPDENFTAAALCSRWDGVDDFVSASFPSGPADFAKILPHAQALPAGPLGPEVRFDGKVAIVTGAASGLGRCYAKAFATLGAAVIVNDIADPTPVVVEIRSTGGKATGCQVGCEDAQKVADAAFGAYGRVDILINNAGFLRDKAFVNMDEQAWKDVLDVHLNGMYQMTKAVWPHFVRQGGGSIVNTASTSGLYGVFGQANYSTAKLGVLGLSEATARQGAKHDIRVNTICPVASTGALAAAWANTSERGKDVDMKAEYNIPAVLLLSVESISGRKNAISGGLFEIGCGLHMTTRLRPVAGVVHKDLPEVTPEAMVSDWQEDVLTKVEFYKDIPIAGVAYEYDDRNVILYNLSAGARRSDLSLVYERSPDFQALPTFGMIPFFSRAVITHHAELLPNFDLNQGVLGEHYFEILRYPIPTSGHLKSSGKLLDVVDRGSAAIVRTGYSTVDANSNEPIFYNETTFFAGGAGGFGGRQSRRHRHASQASTRIALPLRPADKVISYFTSPEQAALYRLNGDREELHIDPAAAKRHGFAHPVLHGMCSMSIAAFYIWETYGSFRSIRARFTRVVVPGDTLVIEMWKETRTVLYRVSDKESGDLCIDDGIVRLLAEDGRTAQL